MSKTFTHMIKRFDNISKTKLKILPLNYLNFHMICVDFFTTDVGEYILFRTRFENMMYQWALSLFCITICVHFRFGVFLI